MSFLEVKLSVSSHNNMTIPPQDDDDTPVSDRPGSKGSKDSKSSFVPPSERSQLDFQPASRAQGSRVLSAEKENM